MPGRHLVRAENDLATAKASFNILLRREINEPLEVVDILGYKPSTLRLEESPFFLFIQTLSAWVRCGS